MPDHKAARTRTKAETVLSLDEALENLSTLAQMPADEKTTIGLLKGEKLVAEGDDFPYTEVVWLFPEDEVNFVENIKPTLQAVLQHLQKLWQKHLLDPENPHAKNTIESIFAFVIDARDQVQEYFSLFGKEVDLLDLKEFKELEKYWEKEIRPSLGKEAEDWEKNWQKNANSAALDFDRSGLKNWDAVKEDRSWELAGLKGENEEPLFNFRLLKSIRIASALESAKKTKQDFILFLENKKNADLQLSSRHVLQMLKQDVERFYKSDFDFSQNRLSSCLSKAFLALFLTANPRNASAKGKNCLRYFQDFQKFLRQALKSKEYNQMLFSGKTNPLFKYANELSYQLFTRIVAIKEEMTGYLCRMKRSGEDKKKDREKPGNFWEKLELFDEDVRLFLQDLPSGPVFKLLQTVKKKQWGFDPLLNSSPPSRLYGFEVGGKISVLLHLPSPTVQEKISQACIAEEFRGFLAGLKERKEKLLFINLQDRTSYKESARAKAIEDLAKRKEFGKNLEIVSLNKDSAFYHQSESYAKDLQKADKFLKAFEEKLFSNNKEDFFLHSPDSNMKNFARELLVKIHQLFFLEKPELSKEQREDFIELFYHFFILKLIEEKKPDFVAFSSKDGVDSAAAMNGSFLVFLKEISKNKYSSAEEKFLSYLFFAPALLIRHRALDPVALNRALGCISHLQQRRKEIKNTFSSLYKKKLFKDIKTTYF